MNSPRILAGERIILTVWIGGIWAIGYIVAPALFANLEDRSLAGSLAGAMFEIIAYVGLACGGLLLLFNQLRHSGRRLNWRALLLLLMLLVIMAGQFLISPMIGELREQGLTESSQFSFLHGAASLLYLFNSLLGLVLVVSPDTA